MFFIVPDCESPAVGLKILYQWGIRLVASSTENGNNKSIEDTEGFHGREQKGISIIIIRQLILKFMWRNSLLCLTILDSLERGRDIVTDA